MDPDKQKEIAEMRPPRDAVGLKSFIGKLSHISRFIPRLAELIMPLRQLCGAGTEWAWQKQHDDSFRHASKLVSESPCLAFFDPDVPIEVECDASKNCLGAALIQRNRPVYFASKAITETQMRYAQIEKELLAVRYALNRFHYFIFPKTVTVYIDHKPLVNIIARRLEEVPLRLQSLLMDIQKNNIKLVFRPGKEIKFADALPRCPLEKQRRAVGEQEVNVISTLPMQDNTIARLKLAAAEDTCKIVIC